MKPPIDRIRYYRKNNPACRFIIPTKPKTAGSKSNQTYQTEINSYARKAMGDNKPILTNDIEVEISWRSVGNDTTNADIDNIVKPILDAMKDVVYKDDSQIRSLLVVRIPKGNSTPMSGNAEDFLEILENENRDSVQVVIYSDSRQEQHEQVNKEQRN